MFPPNARRMKHLISVYSSFTADISRRVYGTEKYGLQGTVPRDFQPLVFFSTVNTHHMSLVQNPPTFSNQNVVYLLATCNTLRVLIPRFSESNPLLDLIPQVSESNLPLDLIPRVSESKPPLDLILGDIRFRQA